MKKRENLVKMILSAMFLAFAYLLPFLTGQLQSIGNKLCPMHIPVLLCGFICGPLWGLAVGATAPLLRSFTLGMPLLFPNAVCMAFELATYGAVAGIMHKALPRKKPFIYCSLTISMIVGRIVFGIAKFICLGFKGQGYLFSAFIAEAVVNALPGIAIQIILIPILVMVIEREKKSNKL